MTDYLNGISHEQIHLPDQIECGLLSDEFFQISNLHVTILAIDGTHISIEHSTVNGHLYYIRKKTFSLNVLALVDPWKKFRFISNGYGSNHDMRVFRNSDTLQNFTEGLSHEFFIVGDKAYRAIEKVRIPTIYGNITEELKEHLGKQRIIVENAFGLLRINFDDLHIHRKMVIHLNI